MKDSNIPGDIIHRISEGDENAFRQFYDIHFRRVFQFARYFLKSEYLCQEVTSDVFLSIWQNRKTISEIENWPSYLYTISKNKAYDYLDKLSRIPDFTNDIPLGISTLESNPEEEILNSELEKVINNAIAELPERCKLVFLMAREGGLKYKDIAAFLSISEKTVQAQMITAMKKLGNELKKYLSLIL